MLVSHLKIRAELDEDAGFLVPHEDQSACGLDYQVHTHIADSVWHLIILSSHYDTDMLLTKYQFIALKQEENVIRNELNSCSCALKDRFLLLRVLRIVYIMKTNNPNAINQNYVVRISVPETVIKRYFKSM